MTITYEDLGYKPVVEVARRLRTKWESYFKGESFPVMECGLPSMLNYKLFPKYKMSVLHGISGSGKSTFAFQYALGVAIQLYILGVGGCVVFNSLEMEETDLLERMAAILSGVDVSRWLNGTILPEEYEKLLKWLAFVEQLPIFIDDESFITTDNMAAQLEVLHNSEVGPVELLITDYGELFADDAGSEEQRVNSIFRNQFKMAHKIGCAVVAISQSTNNRSETGRTFIAGADGTRYSKGILQAADVLVELWNPPQLLESGRVVNLPEESNLSLAHPYLLVQKYRGSSIGHCIPFGWLPTRTTFYDKSISQNVGDETIFTHLDQALLKYKGGLAW